MAALALDERVKSCLQRKQFVLPQQSHYVNAHFCNESVYGTVNLLAVTGLVRMDAAPPAAPPPAAPFDAWPGAEVLGDKPHRHWETKPREWMDEGDESNPEDAPEDDNE